MVLSASDELRHEWDDDPLWRESWYYNFSDPDNRIGAWLYLWVVPNQPKKSGMLVSLYHGLAEGVDGNGLAMASPGHVWHGDDDTWVYCYREEIPELIEEDVDDVTLCGLTMNRLEPLKKYRLAFDDGENASFELDCEFMTHPWDFADNIHPTPPWLAKNRYHRGWKAAGQIQVAGKTYDVRTTGDSDHSWGTRDSSAFGQNNLKTYGLQAPDGSISVKAQLLGSPSEEVPRGYIALGEEMHAVKSIDVDSRYRPSGLMEDISLRVEDVSGHIIEAHMDSLFAAIGGAGPRVGYEGAGTWDVKGHGQWAGIASCWWAAGTTAEQLHSGKAG